MDLKIFHFRPVPAGKRIMKDRFNGSTSYLRCRFLEWTGWYSQDVYQRLLGHYRLFQHFKDKEREYSRITSPIDAYILNYRATQGAKHFIVKVIYFICSTCTRYPYAPIEIEGINRILVNEGASILQKFLADADTNFEPALFEAAEKIQSPEFIGVPAGKTQVLAPVFVARSHHEYNTYHNESFTEVNHHHNESFTGIYRPPAVREGTTGKEKGVFSGRQWLILFDLVSAATEKLKKLDAGTHAKAEKAAALLHALSGKDKQTLIKQLNYYNSKGGLYKTTSPGELQQLIIIVINMSNIFRDNNQPYLAELIDKKIVELEAEKTRNYPKA